LPTADQQSQYCAIFGDIIASREIMERDDLQKRLLLGLDSINSKFSGQLVAPLRFTAGDEVRGLLKDESESYAVIKLLQSAASPHKMRLAVGIGEISTEPLRDIAAIDGPALHRASSAMQLLKSRKLSHGRTVYYCSGNADRDAMLNGLTFLVSSIKSRWTQSMHEKAELLSSGLTQMELGARLGVSHQAVRQSMVRANYYALVEGERLIESLLSDCSPTRLQCEIATHIDCNQSMQL